LLQPYASDPTTSLCHANCFLVFLRHLYLVHPSVGNTALEEVRYSQCDNALLGDNAIEEVRLFQCIFGSIVTTVCSSCVASRCHTDCFLVSLRHLYTYIELSNNHHNIHTTASLPYSSSFFDTCILNSHRHLSHHSFHPSRYSVDVSRPRSLGTRSCNVNSWRCRRRASSRLRNNRQRNRQSNRQRNRRYRCADTPCPIRDTRGTSHSLARYLIIQN